MNYQFFMGKALDQARQALAEGEFPIGCVIVYKNKIVVSGARSGTRGANLNEVDHAEMAALRRLARADEYLDPKGLTLFCTLEPCLMCYGAILLSGIGELVYAYEDVMGGATRGNMKQLGPLYESTGISIIPGIMRAESLELLKSFFSDPTNAYWKGSVLAKYTLDQ
jgi:tRNA(adenine34) deaminase